MRTRQADVRIISATNASLEERVKEGTFREDLFYRLCVFPLHLPPLSQRSDDIVPLAEHFLRRLKGRVGKPVPGLSREVMHYLRSRPWRGNVRELENAIERAVIVSSGALLTSSDFRMLEGIGVEDPLALAPGTDMWMLPDDGVDIEERLPCAMRSTGRKPPQSSKAREFRALYSEMVVSSAQRKMRSGPATDQSDDHARFSGSSRHSQPT